MFEIAVIGALAGNRLGVVRQCIECRSAAGVDAVPCPGFGPGCLLGGAGPERRGEGAAPPRLSSPPSS
jgi:hypothetical protein